MIEKAMNNLKKSGCNNITFVKGDIEEMPFPASHYDVVLSNCVLNLVPDKKKAFSEIFRVLKSGGHFCISDVVIIGSLPEKLRNDAEMYAGCVSGALEKNEYLEIIKLSGFADVRIEKQKEILLPDELLTNYLSPDEINDFQQAEQGIYSITVTAHKA